MRNKMKKVMAGILGAVMTVSVIPSVFAQETDDVILRYDFDGEITSGTNYGATIENGYAYFDGNGDYIHMPDSIVAGCEAATFVVNVRPEMGGANQFTYTIGNSDSEGYLFLNTNNWYNCRFAITQKSHQSEFDLKTSPINQGEWASIAVVMDSHDMRMYINGEMVSANTSDVIVSGLGNTQSNYLAKSQYSGDSYFKGYIEDFRIYSKALSSEEVASIADEHARASDVSDVYIASESFEFESYTLTESIALPSEFEGVNITWQTNNENVLTAEGVVIRPEIDTWVELTATFSDGNGTEAERTYGFMVIHEYTDEEIVQMDMDEIFLVGNLQNLKNDLYLPTESTYGSTITWYSEDENVITHEGKITRAPSGEGARSTKLHLFVTHNGTTIGREYDITVEEEDFAYLFAYFTGNETWQEKMYYGLSRDGYHFNTINGGNPVLESTIGHKAMRDPFVMEGQNGLYYAIFTDMHSTEHPAWNNQSSIIIFESEDLIHWGDGTIIDFKDFEGWENCSRAWAPQAIWDPEFYDEETGEYGAYMIYLALCRGGATQMYKVYSRDMKTLITEPEILYKRADDLQDIDSDIIYKDGIYYMYVKDESAGGIYVVTSRHAGGPYSERINALPRKDRNGKDVAIEGSAIFKLMNEDKYNLVYDAYGAGFFVMSETEDFVNFNQLERNEYSFDFTPRHGYVITISKDEVDALEEAYGKSVAQRLAESKNPIIYYDFEDNTDKSGNFNDAQLAVSATIAQGISGGHGLVLDGTSESYVTIPSEALTGLEDYTISAWIKPDTNATSQRVFDFGTGTDRYMFLTPYYANGLLRGAITAGSYDYEKGVNVETEVEVGRWTHLVMMQDGDTMRIYIDGKFAGEEENVKLDPYEIKHTIPYCYIGKSMWSPDKYFDGTIDEFMIFDRAISEAEVTTLFEKDAQLTYSVAENEGVYTVEFEQNGLNIETFAAIVAQYDENGIMISADYEIIDFAGNAAAVMQTAKTAATYKVLGFESVEKLVPLIK